MTPKEFSELGKKHGVIIAEAADAQEYVNGTQPFPGFTLICNKCNGKNIQIETQDGFVSEAGTGYPTEITVRCRECGYTCLKE